MIKDCVSQHHTVPGDIPNGMSKEEGVNPSLCRNRYSRKTNNQIFSSKMLKEAPKKTVNRFSKTWEKKDKNSLVSEFISIARETNREPDNYHFTVKNGVLTDPNTGKSILNFIAEGVEKDIARSLESWASEKEEGMALWVSPSLEETYPCPKIIIHQIAYNQQGEKVVLNTAILFDGEIVNPDLKRKTLYSFPDSDGNLAKILNWIKRKSDKNVVNKPSENVHKKAEYFAQLLQSGVAKQFVIQEMINSGFIGQNAISCPRSSFGAVSFAGLLFGSSQVVSIGSEKKGWSYSAGHCRICDKDRSDVGPCKICKECEKNF